MKAAEWGTQCPLLFSFFIVWDKNPRKGEMRKSPPKYALWCTSSEGNARIRNLLSLCYRAKAFICEQWVEKIGRKEAITIASLWTLMKFIAERKVEVGRIWLTSFLRNMLGPQLYLMHKEEENWKSCSLKTQTALTKAETWSEKQRTIP